MLNRLKDLDLVGLVLWVSMWESSTRLKRG